MADKKQLPKPRNTPARAAIKAFLETTKEPVSVDTILSKLNNKLPSLDKTTVYRYLEFLTSQNQAVVISIPGKGQLFELVKNSHHHHFVCTDCEKVTPINQCPGNMEKLLPKGATMTGHTVVLTGKCCNCN